MFKYRLFLPPDVPPTPFVEFDLFQPSTVLTSNDVVLLLADLSGD